MATRLKKVVVRRFSSGYLTGYLPSGNLSDGAAPGSLPVLDLAGKLQPLPLADIKYIAYVRDFNAGELHEPERMLRKTFLGRPRNEGLLVRLTLRDDDVLEGLAALDLRFADGWTDDGGLAMVPPDVRGNTQRLFVPRAAIQTLQVIAVVTAPARRQVSAVHEPAAAQTDLFPLPTDIDRP